MTDEEARNSLSGVIQALQASIPIQKAIDNNLEALEKLRAFGYGHAFICQALNDSQGKQITPQMFASMMSRARKKKPAQGKTVTASHRPASTTHDSSSKTPERPATFKHNPTPPEDIFE